MRASPWHAGCVANRPIMLPILRTNPTGMLRNSANLVASVVMLACGKTPDSIPAPSHSSDAGNAPAIATGSASSGVPLDCASADPGDTVSVPEGPFSMGCNAAVDDECRADEKPGHTVSLAAFEIDRNEVTQEEYAACMAAKACDAPSCAWDCSTPGMPAGCITWAQAKAYCSFAGKRLPTEAEWEKAARGTDGRKFPWGNTVTDCALVNMAGCGDRADPVGSHPSGASPYGALDMAGNMVEMVADWYDASYYASSPSSNPTGPSQGTRYGGRGGGYKSEEVWQRTSARDWYDLTDAGKSLGFRCAR